MLHDMREGLKSIGIVAAMGSIAMHHRHGRHWSSHRMTVIHYNANTAALSYEMNGMVYNAMYSIEASVLFC